MLYTELFLNKKIELEIIHFVVFATENGFILNYIKPFIEVKFSLD